MPRRIIGSVVGALAAASLAAPVAQAGTPAKVDVRVEAPGRTIVSTTVTTTHRQVVKDGDPAHACSGTSAAGALELATDGDWTGTWFGSLGYAVDSFDGVKGAADFSSYWTLWVNGRSSTTGVCDTELEAGDEVLEFLCEVTADFSSCTNLPLALRAGTVRLQRDQAVVRVEVVRLAGDGTEAPVAGATVRGGLEAVETGADGSARVELRNPQSRLRATHAGDVPSARLHCTLGAGGGRCGSRDVVPPVLRLRDVGDGETIAAAAAPRLLRGVARDPSGATVVLRLTRRLDGRCWSFDGERGAFRRCRGNGAPTVEVGDRARWSYLLPAKLAAGRYGLVVVATDPAGNRARLKIRFTVEAAG
jgi:hypothetical protein